MYTLCIGNSRSTHRTGRVTERRARYLRVLATYAVKTSISLFILILSDHLVTRWQIKSPLGVIVDHGLDSPLPPPEKACVSHMSFYEANDASIRGLLQNTLKAVAELTATLTALQVQEKQTISYIEGLWLKLKEAERKNKFLQDHIQNTTSAKEQMEKMADECRYQMAPMKRLPTEILLRIFKILTRRASESQLARVTAWGHPVPTRTSLQLAQVCTQWRSIFFLEPSLWDHLDFCFDRVKTPGSGEIFILYRYANAATRPGTLIHRGPRSIFLSKWNISHHNMVLASLEKDTPYESVFLDMTEDGTGQWDTDSVRAESVTVYRSSRINTTNFLMPLLRRASKVTLYGNPPVWGNTPWTSLRTFTLRDFCKYDAESLNSTSFSREDLVKLLTAAPLLTKLELDINSNEEDLNQTTEKRMSHSGIKHLTIHYKHLVGGKGLFGVQLDMPSLQTVEFLSIWSDHISLDGSQPIYTLATPKRIILPKLEYGELRMAAWLVRSLDYVEQLELKGKMTNVFLASILSSYLELPTISKPSQNPGLTALYLTDTNVDGKSLMDLVGGKLKHRKVGIDGVLALEEIVMYNSPGVKGSDWWAIQGMLAEGREMNRIAFAY